MQYIIDISGSTLVKYPVIVDAVFFMLIYLFYILAYRKNNIMCFEVLALPVAFIGIFFKDLILPLVVDDFSFSFNTAELNELKSKDLQLLAYGLLLLGCCHGDKIIKNPDDYSHDNKTTIYKYGWFIWVLSGILLLLIINDYRTGVFNSWFYYSNRAYMDVDDRNQGLGHLTCLLVAASIVDIIRLREKGVSDLRGYLINCNKLFIGEWGFISALLFFSGNRNEMLLIVLPLVVAYSICIQKVSNRIILYAMFAGAVLMALVGLTRMDGVSMDGSGLDLLSFTRDFAPLSYNGDYLVQYADTHGHTWFKEVPVMLLSGVPYIGPLLIGLLNLEVPTASATLTTESVGTAAGMGTSLIGDLYYTAGAIWVMAFMYAIGVIMTRLYHSNKNIGPYKLALYSYMVGNAIYYVRSSWAFPITIVEYVFVILFIGTLFSKRKIS